MTYYPHFICYNFLPLLCDHALDFSEAFYNNAGVSRLHNHPSLNPYMVRDGDIIFVKTDYIVNNEFLNEYCTKLNCRFSIVSGNSSYRVDAFGNNYKQILNDPRLIKWYCVNPPQEYHDKIVPIPIGFEEKERSGGNQEMLLSLSRNKKVDKSSSIFLPFHTLETNEQRKKDVLLLQNNSFICSMNKKQNFQDYMLSLNEYKFAIGLEGSGPDLHRIYECFLMGVIPIIKDNIMRKLIEHYNLPAVFVSSWKEINKKMFDKINEKVYNFNNIDDFLTVSYFKKRIRGEE